MDTVFRNVDKIAAIQKIHEVMDLIDDGYHNREIADLTRVSNMIFYQLPKRYQDLVQKKMYGPEEVPE